MWITMFFGTPHNKLLGPGVENRNCAPSGVHQCAMLADLSLLPGKHADVGHRHHGLSELVKEEARVQIRVHIGPRSGVVKEGLVRRLEALLVHDVTEVIRVEFVRGPQVQVEGVQEGCVGGALFLERLEEGLGDNGVDVVFARVGEKPVVDVDAVGDSDGVCPCHV
jgi:hypothetical protein